MLTARMMSCMLFTGCAELERVAGAGSCRRRAD
jgi:hypothetical protein